VGVGTVVEVLFFGRVADAFGRIARVEIPQKGCTVADLRLLLGGTAEGGAAALAERGVRAAVGGSLVDGDSWVRPDQEVAFFSMFSGG